MVDHFADHVEQLAEILRNDRIFGKLVVLAAERTYRKEYLDLVLGDELGMERSFYPFNRTERTHLIELFRDYGLIGVKEGVYDPKSFANKLEGDSVAIAVCRILNDFRPLEKIVDSLWDATSEKDRHVYICAALAMHCHASGLRYSILQNIAGQTVLNNLFNNTIPLGLAENPENDDFVIPLNAIYADRILQRGINKDQQCVFDAFKGVAFGLAPYVNRNTIKMRTPEARLAGRLLDADKIVKPMLGERANELYETCKKDWAWNSRYWEQRALLISETDLSTALQYARHAVAIESHPFTLTTLGKLLFLQMMQPGQSVEELFYEAFEKLTTAIEVEGYRSRITVHPFSCLLRGTVQYIELGGKLNQAQENKLNGHMGNAQYNFGNDPLIAQLLERLEDLL